MTRLIRARSGCPVWRVGRVASDPCAHTAAPVATSAAGLANAVARLPGTDVVTAPEDVVVGGRPAKHVVIKVRKDIGCPPIQFNMWADSRISSVLRGARTDQPVWILDIGGKLFWLEAETLQGSSQELEQEIQSMIRSVEFE